MKRGILQSLPNDTIFDLIPSLLTKFYENGRILQFDSNTTIFSKGDVLDGLYVPLKGELSLVFEDSKVPLYAGRSLYIPSLLEGSEIPYGVESGTCKSCLFLDSESFGLVMEDYEVLKRYLLGLNYYPSLRNIRDSLLEKGASRELIIKLIGNFSEISITNYETGDGILCVDKGWIKVVSNEQSSYLIDDKVFSGAFLGGAAIVPPYVLPYYIDTYSDDLSVVMIPRKVIDDVLFDQDLKDVLISDFWVLGGAKRKFVRSGFPDLELKGIKMVSLGKDFYHPRISHCSKRFIDRSKKNSEDFAVTICNLLKSIDKDASSSHIGTCLNVYERAMTPLVLSIILDSYGVEVKKLSVEDVDEEDFNFKTGVFFVNENPMLLLAVSSKHLYCWHIQKGFFYFRKKIFKSKYSDTIVFVCRDSNRKITNRYSPVVNAVVGGVVENKGLVKKILLISLAITLLESTTPWFSQILLDEVLQTKDYKTLYFGMLGILLFSSVNIFFAWAKNRYSSIFNIEISASVDKYVYKKALTMEKKKLSQVQAGGVVKRIAELEALKSFLGVESLNNILNFFKVFVFGIFVAMYSFQINAFVFGLLLVLFIIQFNLRKKIRKINLDDFDVLSDINSFISKSISSIVTVKTFNIEKKISNMYERMLVKTQENALKLSKLTGGATSITESINQLAQIGSIWLAIYLSSTGSIDNISAGEILALSMFVQKMIAPLNCLFEFVTNFEDVKVSVDKINEIVSDDDKDTDSGTKNSIIMSGKIRLDRLSFTYPNTNKKILDNLSLYIYPEQIVAFVGKSGCGKTTLANIIAGVQPGYKGKIYYNDILSNFLDLNVIRSQIGYLKQKSDLFAGTIKSNVCYSDDVPDNERLDTALSLSYCDEFLNKMPMGVDTQLAMGGVGLSGGQGQRISIARTMYTDPKILIFDEATSALDSNSEKKFLDNLRIMMRGRTAILIAHRLSTIKKADMIYVLDRGKIVDSGTFEYLSENSIHFKAQFESQIN